MPGRSLPSLRWGFLLLFVAACASGVGVNRDSFTSPESVTAAPPSSVTTLADTATTMTEPVGTTSSTSTAPSTTTTPSAVDTTLAVTTTIPNGATTTAPAVTTSHSAATTIPPPTTTSTTAAIPTTTITILPDDLSVVEVTVRDGRAVGEDRIEVPLGNRISLRFDSDTRLLVHIHGYDDEFTVEAGVITVYEFDGDLPGIFEVEDHVSHRLLVELKVSP